MKEKISDIPKIILGRYAQIRILRSEKGQKRKNRKNMNSLWQYLAKVPVKSCSNFAQDPFSQAPLYKKHYPKSSHRRICFCLISLPLYFGHLNRRFCSYKKWIRELDPPVVIALEPFAVCACALERGLPPPLFRRGLAAAGRHPDVYRGQRQHQHQQHKEEPGRISHVALVMTEDLF